MTDYSKIESPAYIIEEQLLRRNLALIKSVAERAEVEIILAFKAFAMWRVFPVIREYVERSTASSAWEARLAMDEMHAPAHTYAPAYTEHDFDEIIDCSSHITFNSTTQFLRFYPKIKACGKTVSCGLRINPEYSEVETDLYNPAAPGSRLGITRTALGDRLPEGIEGLHFHTLCESSSFALENVLQHVENRFGDLLHQVKWLNMGGGHLMTRHDYDVEHLISLLKNFKSRYPNLKIILEPGAAFVWQTGVLLASVVDIVENGGIRTAILDVSFTCHTPDCLEMPYQPAVRGAATCSGDDACRHRYRLGGNSCLSGDFLGDWAFQRELKTGDRIVFEDMIHYTTVKTTMFNGVAHPSLCMLHTNGDAEILRRFEYKDYKNRMS